MRTPSCRLVMFCGVLLLNLAQAGFSRPLRVNLGSSASPVAIFTAEECRRYFPKLFVNPLQISDAATMPDRDDGFDLVLGTAAANPLIKQTLDDGKLKLPAGPNADQGFALKTIGNTLYLVGATDQGALYGLYELLEAYGAYFQISGERLPDQAEFTVKPLDVAKAPVFKYRGLLPWDNFLCGMSGYDLEHYQELLDRATRLRFNMLQFHFYPGMAFFTETIDGKTVDLTCIGMPVNVFPTKGAVGEKAFNGLKIYGPKPYVDHIGDPQAQGRAVQAMMRQVIDYSHARGFVTCVGFELMLPSGGGAIMTQKPDGSENLLDPLRETNVDLSVKRFRSLTATYPNSDYYWLWQSEGRGYLSRKAGSEPGAKEMRAQFARWAADPNLAGDIDYAYLFREVANRLTPEERARLATGGWSVEHLFPNINGEFPKEPIFASLNSYDMRQARKDQAPSYRVAKEGRRAWMIDWWEFDGDEWFPQFRAAWQEGMYRRCLDYGVESVTLLGWKLTGIEHNVRFLSDFSWNPELTAAHFYADYVKRLYGPAALPLAGLYADYDRGEATNPPATPADDRAQLLSAGWMGLGIPTPPGKVERLADESWQKVIKRVPSLLAEQQKLLTRDELAIKTIEACRPRLDATGREWAASLRNRLEFRVIYLKSMRALNQSLVEYDQVASKQGILPAKKAALVPARAAAELARQGVEKYAEVVRNRGDQGLIAQLNEQYYKTVANFAASLATDRSQYATLDWTAFRLNPALPFNFSDKAPWPARDGATQANVTAADGKPTLQVALGDGKTRFNSLFVSQQPIDLRQAPILDFRLRTTSSQPVAFGFQLAGDSAWHMINIVGSQSLFPNLDTLPDGVVNDGQWHRVTWNLAQLVKEKVSGAPEAPVLGMFIIGAWDTPPEPVRLEFQDFAFGKRNMLD